MNMQTAIEILGINRRQTGDLRETVMALGFHSWLNTAEDTERREAAKYVLRRWPAYQAECNKRRSSAR
ncbi:MAG: hypothetical protein ACREB3_17435 [Burkholderiales bacterium]